MTKKLLSIFVLLSTAGPAGAQQPERTHDIVADDYFTLAYVSGLAVSPTGRYVAYTEGRWDKDKDGRNSDLWVLDRESGSTQRLTFDHAGEGSPSWGPDEEYVYFTSNQKRAGEDDPPYNGKRQVWRIRPDGDGMQAVTRVGKGVGMYELSRDGNTLYYSVSEESIDEEWKDLIKAHKDLEYGHGVTDFTQIWKLDLNTWRDEKLVDEKRVISAMDVSPDGRFIGMLTSPDEELIFVEGWSRIDVYDTQSKKVIVTTPDGWRDDHPSPYGWLDDLAWSGDGKAVAFTISFDGYPPRVYVAEYNGEGFDLSELKRPEGVTVTGGTVKWRGDKRELCMLGEDHARSRVYCIEGVKGGGQGDVLVPTPGDVVVGGYDFNRKGDQLVVSMSNTENPGDLFAANRGKYEQITNINPQVASWKLPQISIVQWIGADGDTVEGILELPPDYKPGKPLPMVVEIHGGPTAASMYRFRLWIYGRALLASKGYALLSPNYRGSTGYGDEFMVELVGRENDIEVKDILAGVDAMVERGIADPDRLAVMGWSNGGYLTNCLVTATDRFKAASSGAGVLDMVIQWGTEDTPGHVVNFVEGLPWDATDHYLKASPMYELDKVKTPTLIHVGENDPRVPAAHARALYRALHHYLDVPTHLVVYPGAGHGLTTWKHRKAKMDWDLAWFEKYLGPATTEPMEKMESMPSADATN